MNIWYSDWEFCDAVYYSLISLSTIGFGDFVPRNDPPIHLGQSNGGWQIDNIKFSIVTSPKVTKSNFIIGFNVVNLGGIMIWLMDFCCLMSFSEIWIEKRGAEYYSQQAVGCSKSKRFWHPRKLRLLWPLLYSYSNLLLAKYNTFAPYFSIQNSKNRMGQQKSFNQTLFSAKSTTPNEVGDPIPWWSQIWWLSVWRYWI